MFGELLPAQRPRRLQHEARKNRDELGTVTRSFGHSLQNLIQNHLLG